MITEVSLSGQALATTEPAAFASAVTKAITKLVDDVGEPASTDIVVELTESSEVVITVTDETDLVSLKALITREMCKDTLACTVDLRRATAGPGGLVVADDNTRQRRLQASTELTAFMVRRYRAGAARVPQTTTAAFDKVEADTDDVEEFAKPLLSGLEASIKTTVTGPNVANSRVDDTLADTSTVADVLADALLVTSKDITVSTVVNAPPPPPPPLNEYDGNSGTGLGADDDSANSSSLLPLLALLVLLPVLPVLLAAAYASVAYPGKVSTFVAWRFSHSSPNLLWRYVPEERRQEMRGELDGGSGKVRTVAIKKAAAFTVSKSDVDPPTSTTVAMDTKTPSSTSMTMDTKSEAPSTSTDTKDTPVPVHVEKVRI